MRFAIPVLVVLSLACGGLRRDANQALREEARAKFVAACTKAGPPGATAPVCTCAADEILRTHTTKELLAFAADPRAKEVVPVVSECARKLAR
jgi:hypothetical protein